MEPDWSGLPRDLLVVIAKRTMRCSVEDLIAFGGVCSSWRSASTDDEIVGAKSSSMVPLLMLSEKKEGNRQFYSVLRNKIFTSLPVPKTNDKRKYIESRFGWVLTLACSGEVELMNPFSAERIQLPNYKILPHYQSFCRDPSYDIILRSVLSANPSHTSDFVLVVITTAYLAFWKNGDSNWTMIKPNEGPRFRCVRYMDVNYFNRDRRFYAVSREGNICVWDAHASGGDFTHVIPKVIFTFDKEATVSIIGEYNDAYLVESSTGELLLITRNGRFIRPELQRFRNLYRYGASEFRVYRIDVTNGVWERLLNLKNEAIFVGHNAAFSIPVSDNNAAGFIKSSSIYFTDDSICAYRPILRHPYRTWDSLIENNFDSNNDSRGEEEEEEEYDDSTLATATGYTMATTLEKVGNAWALELGTGKIDARSGGGKDMGIYNLEDGSIQRFHPEAQTLSFTCPPLWVAPSSFSWLPHLATPSSNHSQ